MSDPVAATTVDNPQSAAAPPKPSMVGGAMRIFVPALLAAAASYGGARAVASHPPPAPKAEHVVEARPPGPTVALEPFLLTVVDGNKKAHAMRFTVAVEFEQTQKEEVAKSFVLRIRDAILSHIRALSYEDATSNVQLDKLRAEILERCRVAGATGAERVLITDFVVQ